MNGQIWPWAALPPNSGVRCPSTCRAKSSNTARRRRLARIAAGHGSGEDVSNVLEYVPASFKVVQHVRPKFACTCCDRIMQAAAPSRPISRGLAGPGLLAHVLVRKYADHVPLHRQCTIYARDGIELSDSTMGDWVGGAHQLLAPLVAALRDHVFAASKLHADDTPVPVLMPGTGKIRQARLWTYVRDDRPHGGTAAPAVWFLYSPDRKGIHPQTHLKNFTGTSEVVRKARAGCLADVMTTEVDRIAGLHLEAVGPVYLQPHVHLAQHVGRTDVVGKGAV